MSTQLNVTSNLHGLSNALVLEKKAARLLKDSIKNLKGSPFLPSVDTISSMQRIVAQAPKAKSGALSPTKMTRYIANNKDNLRDFVRDFGPQLSPAQRFGGSVVNKFADAHIRERKMLERYRDRISSGEVDALDPATLKRLQQLEARDTAFYNAGRALDDDTKRLFWE